MPGESSEFDAVPFAEAALAGQESTRLTQEERDSIEAYALGGYELINGALRGVVPMSAALARRIGSIRSGLRRYPLPIAVRVSREVDAAIYGIYDAETARAVVDGEFIELGFWSTAGSSTPPHSSRHTDPVILELVVPAGTPALRLGDLAEFPAERGCW